MTATCIESVRLLQPGDGIFEGAICFSEGKIVAQASDQTRVDGKNFLLTPGCMDIHTHGIEQYLYEVSPEQFLAGTACLARHGTTSVCPTFYTVMDRSMLGKLQTLANTIDQVTDVCIPGLHLEGPFLGLPGAGAMTLDGDVGLLNELLDATGNRVAVMSIGPEQKNILSVIERLVEAGVVPLITHTRADIDQTQKAVDAGARHATHFYDVFHVPGKADSGVRPVGAVEVILADPRCTVDFIADGVHVHPVAIRMAVAAKGAAGVILITDSNVGAGLPEGVYDTPWGFPVHVAPGKGATNAQAGHPNFGQLAGSALTMPRGLGNLMQWLDLPKADIWAMGTLNVATLLNQSNKGTLAVGADADLVLWDDSEPTPRPVATWVGGRLVWQDPAQSFFI